MRPVAERELGKRPVQGKLPEVEAAGQAMKRSQSLIVRDVRPQRQPQFLGFLVRAAQDRDEARQDLEGARLAAEGGRSRLDQIVEGLSFGKGGLCAEDEIGDPGGEVLAGSGRARLNDDRAALRGPQDIERTTDLEMLARVIEKPDLGRIEGLGARLVLDHRAVVPAIPEAGHDVEELVRAIVAIVVLHMPLEAEILSLGLGL